MEACFIFFLLSLCISFLLKSLISNKSTHNHKLPPGPPSLPIIGRFKFLGKSISQLEASLRDLHAHYGPILTILFASQPAIFVSDASLSHKALIQNSALFSDRPPARLTNKIITSNQHDISSAFYGPTWRHLRRNLTAGILHPSRLKYFSHARQRVLKTLIRRLHPLSVIGEPFPVVDQPRHAMFSLLVLMCFGDKVEEKQVEEIGEVQRRLLFAFSFGRFRILNMWPKLGKFLFRKRWEELLQLRKEQEDVFIPLIRTRQKKKNQNKDENVSYVDTLLDLELPIEKRKLDEGEMVSLCSEFLNAGTYSTSTVLQWIMANLVKNQHIQEKLYAEIKRAMDPGVEMVGEDDLQKMPYLKAVILEGLRRHPPGPFLLQHAAIEDAVLEGYLIPKNGTINFMAAEIGRDPKVWEDPMVFNPERFLMSGDVSEGKVFDITGSREIKMMPFGAGRRMCPGYGLAMLHLEYFVANLIWYFKWTAVHGDEVDLSEKEEITIVMKNPLQACISPRSK